jgi:copper chaperone CopZ
MKTKIYIHDIPGRLRVCTEAVKNNGQAAAAVQDLLAATPGVLSAKANPVTGSIIVTYDTTRLAAPAILGVLHQNGYLDMETNVCERAAAQPSFAGRLLTEVVAPKLGQFVLSWTVERTLAAAVTALL